jgi:hypothetical protein
MAASAPHRRSHKHWATTTSGTATSLFRSALIQHASVSSRGRREVSRAESHTIMRATARGGRALESFSVLLIDCHIRHVDALIVGRMPHRLDRISWNECPGFMSYMRQ